MYMINDTIPNKIYSMHVDNSMSLYKIVNLTVSYSVSLKACTGVLTVSLERRYGGCTKRRGFFPAPLEALRALLLTVSQIILWQVRGRAQDRVSKHKARKQR